MDYFNNVPAPDTGRELSWDDTIENEDREYVLLPAGDYPFQIINLEKGRHDNPQSKIPPCPKAILSVRVTDQQTGQTADLTCNLFLHSSQEWKLCEFFSAIGLRRKGEPVRMDWNRVVGSRGYLSLSVREYQRRDGSTGKSNDIKRFHPAEDTPAPSAPPAYQPPAPTGWGGR